MDQPDVILKKNKDTYDEMTSFMIGDACTITVKKNKEWGSSRIEISDPRGNRRYMSRYLGDHTFAINFPATQTFGDWNCKIVVKDVNGNTVQIDKVLHLSENTINDSESSDTTTMMTSAEEIEEIASSIEDDQEAYMDHVDADIDGIGDIGEETQESKYEAGSLISNEEAIGDDNETLIVNLENDIHLLSQKAKTEDASVNETEIIEFEEEDESSEFMDDELNTESIDVSEITDRDEIEISDNESSISVETISETTKEDPLLITKIDDTTIGVNIHDRSNEMDEGIIDTILNNNEQSTDNFPAEEPKEIELMKLTYEEQIEVISKLESEVHIELLISSSLDIDIKNDLEIPIAELEVIKKQFHSRLKEANILYLSDILETKPIELFHMADTSFDDLKNWLLQCYRVHSDKNHPLRKEYRRIRAEYHEFQRQLETLMESKMAKDPLSVLVGVNDSSMQRLNEAGILTVGGLLQIPMVDLINLEVDPDKPLLPKLWIANAKSYVGIK